MSRSKHRNRKPEQTTTDREPPHALEAEQALLACPLIEPSLLPAIRDKIKDAEVFYDLRNQIIWAAMMKTNGTIDIQVIYQKLKDGGQLQEAGGLEYLSKLPDAAPSASNWAHYAQTVLEKYQLRLIVERCQDVISRIYESRSDIEDLMFATRSDLLPVITPNAEAFEQIWTVRQLNNFNIRKDPNALIGVKEGQATRYLCRGYGCWLIGPSGVGKSSLIHQAAFSWALGRAVCGIEPVRALRILIIQAENDEGDAAEMTQGILKSFEVDPDDVGMDDAFEQLNENVKIVTERLTTGDRFCSYLGRQIEKHRADIAFVDPFLSFAGVDVNRQDQCTKFLRGNLNPVLADTGAALFAAHHTGKPKVKADTRNWTAVDYAYAGIGSSELVNWARAVMVLLQLGDLGDYELKLAKRGSKAGATHPGGEFTTSIFLRHARDRIFWQQIEPPEPTSEHGAKGGKPSVCKEIACSNLHEFLAGCSTQGEGLNEISKRLEKWLAKQDKDVSPSSCKRIVALMVDNHKLHKNPELLYVKGKNA